MKLNEFKSVYAKYDLEKITELYIDYLSLIFGGAVK